MGLPPLLLSHIHITARALRRKEAKRKYLKNHLHRGTFGIIIRTMQLDLEVHKHTLSLPPLAGIREDRLIRRYSTLLGAARDAIRHKIGLSLGKFDIGYSDLEKAVTYIDKNVVTPSWGKVTAEREEMLKVWILQSPEAVRRQYPERQGPPQYSGMTA